MRLDRDERLALMPIENRVGEELLKDESFAVRENHWHLVTTEGVDIVGGPAGVMLLEQLKPTRYLGRALRLLHLTPVVGLGDAILARMRPHLVRFVNSGHAPKRYP